jgi:hypothetical protein
MPLSEEPCASVADRSAAAMATVLSLALSSLTVRLVSGPSGTSVAPRMEETSRILSMMPLALVVAMALRPGSLTRWTASRSACA